MKKFIFVFLFLSPLITLALDDRSGNLPPRDPALGPSSISYKIDIPPPLKFCENKADCTLPKLITVLIDSIVIPIGSVIAVLMIMYAGFLYVTARGDPTRIKEAHDALLYAIIGAAILLGAKLLAAAIEGTITQLK